MNRTPFLWRGRWPWLSLALLGAGLALATSGRALWNRSRAESVRRDARAAAQQQDWIALEQHAREQKQSATADMLDRLARHAEERASVVRRAVYEAEVTEPDNVESTDAGPVPSERRAPG